MTVNEHIQLVEKYKDIVPEKKIAVILQQCNCDCCSQNASCVHKNTVGRFPKELGGLGFCPRVTKKL